MQETDFCEVANFSIEGNKTNLSENYILLDGEYVKNVNSVAKSGRK